MYTEMSLQCSFEGVGGLNVLDVRREGLPLLWSMVRERALARGFHFKIGMRIKCLCLTGSQVYFHLCVSTGWDGGGGRCSWGATGGWGRHIRLWPGCCCSRHPRRLPQECAHHSLSSRMGLKQALTRALGPAAFPSKTRQKSCCEAFAGVDLVHQPWPAAGDSPKALPQHSWCLIYCLLRLERQTLMWSCGNNHTRQLLWAWSSHPDPFFRGWNGIWWQVLFAGLHLECVLGCSMSMLHLAFRWCQCYCW